MYRHQPNPILEVLVLVAVAATKQSIKKGGNQKVRSKMAPSITDRTISACNDLQISSIPKDWADHAWNSDFLESQGFPEVLENNIFDCGCFVRELQELLVITRLWTTAEGQGSLNEGNFTFLIVWFTEPGAFDLRLTILCIVKEKNSRE